MPKKFGINTKKEEAKIKEQAKKKEEKEKKEKQKLDEFWKEDDPKVLEKINKEKEKEQKRLEAIKRKQENKELAEKEMNELLENKKNELKAPTLAEINEHKERTMKRLLEQNKQKEETTTDEVDVDKEFVNENYGKLDQVTQSGAEIVEASGLEQALEELSVVDYDKHPEKRMRAAWNAYFEKELPMFKIAYPNLKRTQYIHLIQKEFKTSPDNPVYAAQLKGKGKK